MNIYKVDRTDNVGWDSYYAFVCVAANGDEARNMHPGKGEEWPSETWDWVHHKDIDTLTVEYIGTADGPARIILAAFWAG